MRLPTALALLALCGLTGSALAQRTMNLPPLSFDTVHGGVINDAAGNPVVCVTADMTAKTTDPAIVASGVLVAYHTYNLALTNLSSTPQTIQPYMLAGSAAGSTNSNGNAAGVPLYAGPSLALTSDQQLGQIVLPPYGSGVFSYLFVCSSNTCYVRDVSGGLTVAVSPGGSFFQMPATCGTGAPQVCINIQSRFNFRLVVNEDRGAVIGNITCLSHRCNGVTDHYISPPAAISLNGGRPF